MPARVRPHRTGNSARVAREEDTVTLCGGLGPGLAAVAGSSGSGRCSLDTQLGRETAGRTRADPGSRTPDLAPATSRCGIASFVPAAREPAPREDRGRLRGTPGSESLETPRAFRRPRPRKLPGTDKARLGHRRRHRSARHAPRLTRGCCPSWFPGCPSDCRQPRARPDSAAELRGGGLRTAEASPSSPVSSAERAANSERFSQPPCAAGLGRSFGPAHGRGFPEPAPSAPEPEPRRLPAPPLGRASLSPPPSTSRARGRSAPRPPHQKCG